MVADLAEVLGPAGGVGEAGVDTEEVDARQVGLAVGVDQALALEGRKRERKGEKEKVDIQKRAKGRERVSLIHCTGTVCTGWPKKNGRLL